MSKLGDHVIPPEGLDADLPDLSDPLILSLVPVGAIFSATDTKIIYRRNIDETWHEWATITGGSGDVATDAIWDATGDLAVGSGANTADNLTVGSDGDVLTADSGETLGVKWAPAGGAGLGAKLYDHTLSGAQSSIDTNVDGSTVANFAGYDLLEIILLAQTVSDGSAAVAGVTFTLNNDGGSNYDQQYVRAITTTVSGAAANAAAGWTIVVPGSGAGNTGYQAATRVTIPGYAGTSKFKTGIMATANVAVDSNGSYQAQTVGWRSTSAITRVKASAGGFSLAIGSRLIVIGF